MITRSSQLDGIMKIIRIKDNDHPQLPVGQLPEIYQNKRRWSPAAPRWTASEKRSEWKAIITHSSQLDCFLKMIRIKGDDHLQLLVRRLPESDQRKTMITRSSQLDSFLKTTRIKGDDQSQLPVGRLPENDQNKRWWSTAAPSLMASWKRSD